MQKLIFLYRIFYPFQASDNLECGHQAMKNRTATLAKIDGVWAMAPDNPARYARRYGNEILHHVPWVVSSQNAYDNKAPKFKS
jgi:hypothetical protein